MKNILVILSIVFLIVGCSNRRWFPREILDAGASDGIEESKARGAFIFEYEPCACCIYDSIIVRVVSAFAEYDSQYADYYSDSIEVNHNAEHIVVQFAEKYDSYPGYFGDSLTCKTDSSIINWSINDWDYPYSNVLDCSAPVPDTIKIPIIETEKSIKETYEHSDVKVLIREDTIGYLKLVRKQ